MQKYDINVGKKEYRKKFTSTFVATILLLTTFTTLFLVAAPIAGEEVANIWTTDEFGIPKSDFYPEELVYIQGSGFYADTDITLNITRPDGWLEEAPDSVPEDRFLSDVLPHTDTNGAFENYIYDLDGIFGQYLIQASDGINNVEFIFTDAPPPKLDQAKNGHKDSPVNPAEWVNGNLNENQAHYLEGYSVPYRCEMVSLPTDGTELSLTIGFDIKEKGNHALDFLTYYNRTNNPNHFDVFGHYGEKVDPLIGITGVSDTVTTFTIPPPSSDGSPVPGQPTQSYNDIISEEGIDAVKMTLFGGTISDVAYVSHGDLTVATSETVVIVNFTADSSTAVLAWGGHIASRTDWGYFPDGSARSAGDITGSPYHMRL
ncbi:MAG: hypothetical protein KAR55_05175, partial [Thermoplasmatales archaeon]|nr:hypothetical protein [Thermoplasmatales archaeon]